MLPVFIKVTRAGTPYLVNAVDIQLMHGFDRGTEIVLRGHVNIIVEETPSIIMKRINEATTDMSV